MKIGRHANGQAERDLKDHPELLADLANAEWVRIPAENLRDLDDEVIDACAWAELEGTDFLRGYAMGQAVAAATMMRPKEVWAYPQRRPLVAERLKALTAEIAAVQAELLEPFTGTPHIEQEDG
jgi:hypothetical protein